MFDILYMILILFFSSESAKKDVYLPLYYLLEVVGYCRRCLKWLSAGGACYVVILSCRVSPQVIGC